MKFLNIIFLVILLSGCEQKPYSYVYLLQHPAILEKELSACQIMNTAGCDEVQRAARDYSNMMAELQEDPEAFGQKILQAQTELAKKQKALPAEYAAQLEKVQAMLAIAALSGPD